MIRINRPPCPNPTALSGGNYKHPDNKRALQDASHDKCMYCESKINHIYFGDVEHIRPKSGYPHLEFIWDNLGYVCVRCNGAKSNKFSESTPYVNPYNEEPNDHIVMVGAIAQAKRGSEIGELTIKDIELNRPSLIERRWDTIKMIEKSINGCFRTSNSTLRQNALSELKKEAGLDKEYSLCIKMVFSAHQIN